MNRLEDAIQRSVVLSSGWDIMDFIKQLENLAGGNVAFATIPVLDEAGWSDDGMQSVVRVDPAQVQEWVAGLLHDQDEGKTEKIAYSPDKTTVDVVNDTDINGLASAVSDTLSTTGFPPGTSATTTRNTSAIARSRPPRPTTSARRRWPRSSAACRWWPTARFRRARCGWCWPVTTPAPGRVWRAAADGGDGGPGRGRGAADAPPPSPIITAGSDDPKCVN